MRAALLLLVGVSAITAAPAPVQRRVLRRAAL